MGTHDQNRSVAPTYLSLSVLTFCAYFRIRIVDILLYAGDGRDTIVFWLSSYHFSFLHLLGSYGNFAPPIFYRKGIRYILTVSKGRNVTRVHRLLRSQSSPMNLRSWRDPSQLVPHTFRSSNPLDPVKFYYVHEDD